MKIFNYIAQLDCFVVNHAYKEIADKLGLTEWNEVVWIGRYFLLDNDFGEHWFDNWDLREKIEDKAKKMGYEPSDLLIIDASRFKDNKDGPCHSEAERKRFWTDVLKSLDISKETIINEARHFNNERDKADDDFINDFEGRVELIMK